MLLLFITQPAPAQPGFINAALVVGDMWQPLNAQGPSDAIFWTEQQLYEWVDEAVKRFARKHAAFVVYDTSLSSAINTANYNLPAGHLVTFQADLNGFYLRSRNVQEMEALDSQWTTAAGSTPQAFLEDTKGLLQLTLYPPPDVAHSGLPIGLAMATTPANVTKVAAILLGPPILQDYFKFYALAEARTSETNASMDEVGAWYRQLVDQLDQIAEHLWSTHGQ